MMKFVSLVATIPFIHGLAAERQTWNPFRFVEQSSKFVKLPFVGTNVPPTVIRPGDVVWKSGSKAFQFAPLDDVVMGGVSSSSFDNSRGIWKGQVTDANNGGFIGIRSTPSVNYDMPNCRGLQVKVKLLSGNKEKRFKFVARDSTDFNGITWATSVDAKPNRETEWKIPFDKQIPTRFANTVPNQVFDKSKVAGFQFAFSKFEYEGDLNPKFEVGDVELQILEIRAY